MAGREIFAKRTQLRAFKNQSRFPIEVENPFTGFRTTEIQITSELEQTVSTVVIKPGPDNKDSPSLGYEQYSVNIASAPMSPRLPSTATIHTRNNRAAVDANIAAWGYTKVAILFFVSLLITWVPSSINRVYSLIYPDLISVPFSYASGVVLPLMGFWNSVIYITTSWAAVKMLFSGTSRRPVLWRVRPGGDENWRMSNPKSSGSTSDSVRALARDEGV